MMIAASRLRGRPCRRTARGPAARSRSSGARRGCRALRGRWPGWSGSRTGRTGRRRATRPEPRPPGQHRAGPGGSRRGLAGARRPGRAGRHHDRGRPPRVARECREFLERLDAEGGRPHSPPLVQALPSVDETRHPPRACGGTRPPEPGVDKCLWTHYFPKVIRSFRHRGLKRFYGRGDKSLIRPDLHDRVEAMPAQLDVAGSPEAMRLPHYRLHALKGGRRGLLVGHRQGQLAARFPLRECGRPRCRVDRLPLTEGEPRCR